MSVKVCRCGMTDRERRLTAACHVPGCPDPSIAARARPRVSARDLRHDGDAVRFGHAILKCEGYAPSCSEAGACLNGGQCFGSRPNIVAARMIEAMIPAERFGVHYAYLRKVAEMLREDRVAI